MKHSKYYFREVLVIALLLIVIFYAIKIINYSKRNHIDWVKNKTLKHSVLDIYQGYKGKPNYKIMLLSDSQRLTVPEAMLYKLAIGDSVFKQKDSSFYIFKNNKTNAIIKVEY
jgi:cAMP phosphodiesterase